MFRHAWVVLSLLLVVMAAMIAPIAAEGGRRQDREGGTGTRSLACCTLRSIGSAFGCSADPQAAGSPPEFSSVCAVLYGLTGAFCGDSVVCGG